MPQFFALLKPKYSKIIYTNLKAKLVLNLEFFLLNIFSLTDYVIFLITPIFAQLFFPKYLGWAITFAFVILLFVNNFTWSMKK